MPARLVSRKVQEDFKRITQQLVDDLGEPLVVVQESPMFVTCPNCIWDSINKKSSNVFDSSFTVPVTIFQGTSEERTISPIPFSVGRCPVCLGEGQLFTNQEVCIRAMINFSGPGVSREGNPYLTLPPGKEGSNLCLVKTKVCHYELLLNNQIFVVHNGVKCEKFKPPIVRGLGGAEAVVEMWLLTSEIGERVSAKFKQTTGREDDPRRRIKGPTDIRILRGQQKGRDS